MILLAAPFACQKVACNDLAFGAMQADRSNRLPYRRSARRSKASPRVAASTASILSRLANASSDEVHEAELKRVLETALGNLDILRAIYEGRVSRWEEEMVRLLDEREIWLVLQLWSSLELDELVQ